MIKLKKSSPDELDPRHSPSLKNWGDAPSLPQKNVTIECGWGRLLFAHTFESNEAIVDCLKDEKTGFRDLALYLRDPQVIIAQSPHTLFIDPSYTYRLLLRSYDAPPEKPQNFTIREIDPKQDVDEINRIYQSRQMVPLDAHFLRTIYKGKFIKYWVAVDNASQQPIGVVMTIDHKIAFDDPENGASLWAVAVDSQAKYPGIGLALVHHVAEHFKEKGRRYIDLSVFYENKEAIALYEKLGFQQVSVFCVKNKNAINEKLFSGPQPDEQLNPYAEIIVNEARRRGIMVRVLDIEDNYFQLSYGGRSIVCRESLSELTSSIAMSRCSDKQVTLRLMRHAGLQVPDQQIAGTMHADQIFLQKHKRIVVKPAVGEQGAGITIDVRTNNELSAAIEFARKVGDKVLLEQMVEGQDLRIIVIGNEVVAASIRKPPTIIGDGKHSILDLVQKLSRRRQQATQGESRIPIDAELKRTINNAGYRQEDILPAQTVLIVRRTPNLHTGGTMHDVTNQLHPDLIEAAKQAAIALDIPVVGMDFMVKDPTQSDYYIIEANERPGLANHEPQPTAEKFIDLLFPQSVTR